MFTSKTSHGLVEMIPRIACPNLFDDIDQLNEFANDHGFDGVDWTFRPENMPRDRSEESSFVSEISRLKPLAVRYHCFFTDSGFGDQDPDRQQMAMKTFHRALRLVSKVQGKSMTIHVGLGRDSSEDLSWSNVVDSLRRLVNAAADRRIKLCLENLPYGWTSRPDLYEKLIRKTNSWATLDIGHAKASEHLISQVYDIEDFVAPHPERFLNAHVYDYETLDGHSAPQYLSEIDRRLDVLIRLPLCDWWVLELREETALKKMLSIAREYFKERLLQQAI